MVYSWLIFRVRYECLSYQPMNKIVYPLPVNPKTSTASAFFIRQYNNPVH